MNFKKRVNGSWTNTPYYIHKTDVDTFTTLPTVLYPTGTTATVGLKGQTLQSSTPSPTSPVMPQGAGDLETSGTKIGQYKVPISSANTTTPVYLGEVQTTRKIKKLVLTGEEQWRANPTPPDSHNVMSIIVNNVLRGISPICTHYIGSVASQWVNIAKNHITTSIMSGNYTRLAVNVDMESLDEFKFYLAAQYAAGTPVTVWYVLAEPENVVVNEPLMKIGDYADAVSNVSIPVTVEGNTLSVGTTVQPSEVTVNYKGWHPNMVHERKNEAWT